MSIRLRPHHVLCSIGFDGNGFDAAFTANMSHIVRGQLGGFDGRKVKVQITAEADSLCAACPHRRGMGCDLDLDIRSFDARHGAALGLKAGDRLDWGDCLSRAARRIVPEDLDTLCAGCRWLKTGKCKQALADLIETEGDRPMIQAAE
ncbi:MAG: DUF1284 domain-containing protein [Jannaschia sp.]